MQGCRRPFGPEVLFLDLTDASHDPSSRATKESPGTQGTGSRRLVPALRCVTAGMKNIFYLSKPNALYGSPAGGLPVGAAQEPARAWTT